MFEVVLLRWHWRFPNFEFLDVSNNNLNIFNYVLIMVRQPRYIKNDTCDINLEKGVPVCTREQHGINNLQNKKKMFRHLDVIIGEPLWWPLSFCLDDIESSSPEPEEGVSSSRRQHWRSFVMATVAYSDGPSGWWFQKIKMLTDSLDFFSIYY
jgi:hypothetical protein